MKIQTATAILSWAVFPLLTGSVMSQGRTVEKQLKGKGVTLAASDEASTRTLTGRRDLTKYADGGHFKFKYFPVKPDEQRTKVSNLSNFLIDNLAGQRLAYLRVTHTGIDAGATYHFFVEPDRSGRWGITTRMIGWHALGKGGRVVDFPRAYRLESVEQPSRILELKFFDKLGDEIEQLNEIAVP